MVPKLSQWQALPWDAKQIYIAFMSFPEQMQFALNKKLEQCTSTLMCTFLIKGPSRLFGCTCTCKCISSGSKRKSDFISIDTDVLALVTKSECAVIVKNNSQNLLSANSWPSVGRQLANSRPTVGQLPANCCPSSRTHSPPAPIHGQYQEQRALKKKKPVWYDSFLEESNVWEITNYKICLKKLYLTW